MTDRPPPPSPAPWLVIELKKPRDGPPSLACVRADGSRTWARLHPFFPTHDLTHCAVESALGLEQAFFGLVARGWDLDTFAEPGAASRLPPEALWAEHLVGLLERRVADDAPGLMAGLLASLPAHQAPPPGFLTEAALARLRAQQQRLHDMWTRLPPGETLRIPYPYREIAE